MNSRTRNVVSEIAQNKMVQNIDFKSKNETKLKERNAAARNNTFFRGSGTVTESDDVSFYCQFRNR